MMGQNTAPVKDNGYSLINSITTLYSESPVKCSVHFTVRTETKTILSCSGVHKTHPFFLTLHSETSLMHPLPICSSFSLHGDHKNMAHFLWDLVLDASNYVVRTFTEVSCYIWGFSSQPMFITISQKDQNHSRSKHRTVTVTWERNEVCLRARQPTHPSITIPSPHNNWTHW